MSGATPRITRSRANTPLPSVSTRQSHAYGARGKAAVTEQVTTSAAEMNAAFATTARPRGSARPHSKKQKATPVVEEYEDDDEEEDEGDDEDDDDLFRPGTAIQHSAAYFNTPAVEGDYQPGAFVRFLLRIVHLISLIYGQGWQLAITSALTFMAFWTLVCMVTYYGVAGWVATRDMPTMAMGRAFGECASVALFSDNIQQLNMSEYQWAINAHLLGRVETLENDTSILQQHLDIHQAMIDELQQILPNTIAMAEENGELAIPPLFWKALAHKMQSPDASPLWQHFLDTNAQQLRTLSKEVFSNDFEEMIKSKRAVSQDDFNLILTQHSEAVHEDLEQTVRKFKISVLEEARNVAVGVLEKSEIMSLARMQIQALGQANYIHNIDKRIRQVNYIGLGLGAMVDPYYTSDTKMPSTQTWGQWMLHHAGLARQYPNPPSVALIAWEDATDAWCAAPSQDERALAQLTVKTAHKIYLTELTIEHIPSTGTRDSASAPKDFEIWVQVANAREAKRINKANEGMIHWHTSTGSACKGKAPSGEKNWVCLAGEQYDIHEHNFVQNFRIWPDTQDLNIATDRIAVRVLSNWGNAQHTCLYRVRATGVEVV